MPRPPKPRARIRISRRCTDSLERHWEIEDITGVDYKDMEITKDDRGVSLHVAYDDSAPYVANVSLAVHFDKTVKVQ